ncbi:MAG: hypothetical protein KY475_12860, partial [Planctomycetes bacterium]|nr:hypothetical protein [Planctomycetota bacterium]
TREAALVALIPTDRPEMLVAFSLLWAVSINVYRGMLGLGWMWYGHASPHRASAAAEPAAEPANSSP